MNHYSLNTVLTLNFRKYAQFLLKHISFPMFNDRIIRLFLNNWRKKIFAHFGVLLGIILKVKTAFRKNLEKHV